MTRTQRATADHLRQLAAPKRLNVLCGRRRATGHLAYRVCPIAPDGSSGRTAIHAGHVTVATAKRLIAAYDPAAAPPPAPPRDATLAALFD